MNNPFLTDIKTLRTRARRHIEQGAVTPGYHADRDVVLKLLNEVECYAPRTRRTILPRMWPLSRRRCACAASANGNCAPMCTLRWAATTARLSRSNSRTPGVAS